MLRRGVTTEALADKCGVDPKTVERWISLKRMPHRKHRWRAAELLEVDEIYLWPGVVDELRQRRQEISQSELVHLYPDRAAVPREVWLHMLTNARKRIDVLIMSGTFFAQMQPRVAAMLTRQAEAGVEIRLCFGDPDSDAAAIRDREEGLRGALSAKIRASLLYYRPLLHVEKCQIRLHQTTLYNSLFRYDDDIFVNPHAYGEPASLNPVFHLRRIDGGTLFDHYTGSFEHVWDMSSPWHGMEG